MALVCVSESLVLLTPTHRQAEEGKEVAVEEERVEVTVEKVEVMVKMIYLALR